MIGSVEVSEKMGIHPGKFVLHGGFPSFRYNVWPFFLDGGLIGFRGGFSSDVLQSLTPIEAMTLDTNHGPDSKKKA